MRQREFIGGLASVAFWPVYTLAQPQAVPTIEYLSGERPEAFRQILPAFQRGSGNAGYFEGRSVAFESRGAALSAWAFTRPSTNARAALSNASGEISTSRAPASAAAASLHLTQASPDRLVVARTHNSLKAQDGLPSSETINDGATIEKLYQDILALPPLPAGRFDCPRDSGLRYRLDFYVGNALLLSGDYAPTGCRTISLSDGTVKRDTRGSFNIDFMRILGLASEEKHLRVPR
jgi:hypothetical protein